MRILVVIMAAITLCAGPVLGSDTESRWWKTRKIQFMWGQWNHARVDKSVDLWEGTLPRELFRNVAQAGGTVFAEMRGCRLEHARFAHEFGLKYFATVFANSLATQPGGRRWVKQSGEDHWFKCPLDQASYERWIVEPQMEGLKEGVVDGIHVDWEYYGGRGEAKGICYCDDCFATFLRGRNVDEAVPEKTKRFGWLSERNLVAAYEANYHQRRFDMFTSIRKTMHAIKPDMLFSSYGASFSDFTRAVNTPQTPFIFLDARHYGNDDRQAWWESYGTRFRQEGYLYIPGGWTNALFGAQASQVSAARWIYEAAINEDGCWMWFERELDDEILRAYATADAQVKEVEHKVGKYLFQGERDGTFASAVEWTGRPELERAVVHQTYRLGPESLVHLNNVDTDWPIRVSVRLPRLPQSGQWTVRDGLKDIYYSPDGVSDQWTRDELRTGVLVTMEPRSDLFLLVSPAGDGPAAGQSRLLQPRRFSVLPDHEAASVAAGPIKATIKLYLMKNAMFGPALEGLLSSTTKVVDLPKDGWLLKMDKQKVGAADGWFRPQTPTEDWTPIEIEKFWGDKGGIGAGWYRRDVDIPKLPDGKRVYLHFGAVDEHMVLWIDGVYAGDYDREIRVGWDKPFAVEVTEKLTSGKHHLAIRVHNVSGAGGIWKPVSVLVGGETADAVQTAAGDSLTGRATGRLVYTATESMGFGGYEGGLTIGNAIRTVDLKNDEQVRIRQLRGHLWSPQYAPDAKRIAYVHDAGGRGQIHLMNVDGSGVVNLSNNAHCDRSPRWSPGGERIAFMSDRGGDWDIFVMTADGSDQRRLAGHPGLDRAPAWSPDGTRLAWESHVSGTPAVWVCDADGQNSRPLVPPDRHIEVELPENDNDGFVRSEIESEFNDNTYYMMDPVWSPDGRRIAAVTLIPYATTVTVTDVDEPRMLRLIRTMPGAAGLCWSSDGTHLAGSSRTAPNETERSGIFVIKVDGSSTGKGWFKGKWLVDVTPQGPRVGGGRRHGLMTWYTHGSAQPRRVVKTFTSLAWSPDSGTLAFSSDMDPSGAFHVYTIPADGGEPRRIDQTRSAWPNELAWRTEPQMHTDD